MITKPYPIWIRHL
uniref:Uncharacterized protein n=1 Tax=Romanomermis culicivorax TaxID=13658 RepID=A0A915INP6_ROMCU